MCPAFDFLELLIQLSSVQDGIYTCFGKPIIMCSTPFFRSFPSVAFRTVSVFASLMMTIVVLKQSIKRRLFLSPSLLQAFSGVMSLALCLLVVSQAPQHFRSSKTVQALHLLIWVVGRWERLTQAAWWDGTFQHGCRLLHLCLPILGWLQAVLLRSRAAGIFIEHHLTSFWKLENCECKIE